MLSLNSTTKLRSGVAMPVFGLGTWLAAEGECQTATKAALNLGYRLIDTATMYKNETEVGEAVRGFEREKVFVVSKLATEDHGREATLAAIDSSLNRLGLKHLDLWLMHSPNGGKVVETWKAMVEVRQSGKARAIGVCNFGPAQLEQLKAAGLEMPEVNQFELHVWLQQREAVEYCLKEGIVVMSYCPLARAKQFGSTPLADIAKRVGRTEAEVAIRWCLQKGFVTIPKSTNEGRLKQNATFGFELSDETMKELEGVDCGFKASNSVNAMDRPWDEVA